MLLLLLFMASLLPCGADGGEISWGREATPHSRPYMASISHSHDGEVKRNCGGFLVREDFVLTAAHCRERNMSVTLGAHNLNKNEKNQQVIPVFQAFLHKSYSLLKRDNDIMLLKLRYKARLTSAVKLISLPSREDWEKPGQVCSVAGWGRTSNGRYPSKLREVELQVQAGEKCQRLFRYFNASTQLCVGSPGDRKCAGAGDSGGPLVCGNVAKGIVSYGLEEPERPPEVFTKVSSYLDWIDRIMNVS
ncbi:mast cell protease 8-like [Erinaceus europaeus]|uniref:Mast cell protease 8-like n=1 Tax=Erinaceus europaeus TaxID=9365 RepID=A0A1S3AMI1_ERIEU|nr:mast cell protease 8-like [Erinaceus europaeus]